MAAAILFNAAASLLLKLTSTPTYYVDVSNLQKSTPGIMIVILSGFFYILAFLMYMFILRRLPVSVAYPFGTGATTVVIALVANRFFGEQFGFQSMIGTGLVLAGIYLLANGRV